MRVKINKHAGFDKDEQAEKSTIFTKRLCSLIIDSRVDEVNIDKKLNIDIWLEPFFSGGFWIKILIHCLVKKLIILLLLPFATIGCLKTFGAFDWGIFEFEAQCFTFLWEQIRGADLNRKQ